MFMLDIITPASGCEPPTY